MTASPDPSRASLADLARRGYCIDGWPTWQQGRCGTYAVALLTLDPTLQFGGIDFDGHGTVGHFAVFDDRYAYDSAGRHPLPYRGVHGDGDWLGRIGTPDDWGLPHDEAGPEGPDHLIRRAVAHARRHGILDGRYGPDRDPPPDVT